VIPNDGSDNSLLCSIIGAYSAAMGISWLPSQNAVCGQLRGRLGCGVNLRFVRVADDTPGAVEKTQRQKPALCQTWGLEAEGTPALLSLFQLCKILLGVLGRSEKTSMIWEYCEASTDPNIILAREAEELYRRVRAEREENPLYWILNDEPHDAVRHLELYRNLDFVESDDCHFCNTPLSVQHWNVQPEEFAYYFPDIRVYVPRLWGLLGKKEIKQRPKTAHRSLGKVKICNQCGWWLVCYDTDEEEAGFCYVNTNAAWGILKTLPAAIDLTAPIQELVKYLSEKAEQRFNLTPRNFEEIVADIFKACGCRVRLTSFSGDRGIDVVILDAGCNDIVGVQVKRWKQKVGAEEIRAFVGSLKLEGRTTGVFVTTSEYTRGAQATSMRAANIGVPIQLVNPPQFYDRLGINERPPYASLSDASAAFHTLLERPELVSASFGKRSYAIW